MLKRLFKSKRKRTKLLRFHTGTKGLTYHSIFIRWVDEYDVKIIHAYTMYYDYQDSKHKPESLNYVIQCSESEYAELENRTINKD